MTRRPFNPGKLDASYCRHWTCLACGHTGRVTRPMAAGKAPIRCSFCGTVQRANHTVAIYSPSIVAYERPAHIISSPEEVT